MLKTFFDYFNIANTLDITIIFSGILIFLIIYEVYKNKFQIRITKIANYAMQALILLLIWMFISSIYTSSEQYVFEKYLRFFTVLLGVFFPIIIKKFSIEYFHKWFVVLVTLMSILYIPLFVKSFASYALGEQPDGIYSSYLTMGYIIGTAIFINGLNSAFSKIIQLIIFGILLMALFITGARGPLVGLVLGFLVIGIMYLFNQKRLALKKPKIQTAIFLILSIILFSTPVFDKLNISDVIERTYNRVVSLESIQDDNSASGRIQELDFVMSKMEPISLLIGYGFGSYGFERVGQDIRYYPHNILLELLFEVGVIGLLLYLIFVLMVILKLIEHKNYLLWGLFIYLFFNSLKSLSITDSRLMFGFFILILLMHRSEKKV